MNHTSSHSTEIASGQRFGFGENWARFLRLLDGERITDAEHSLKSMLGIQSLKGLTFLDAGSGSGLFSLAARRLGARVHSFDYDPNSVACTRRLRERHAVEGGDSDERLWTIDEGSVLDAAYLNGLGQFDVVYSWGVLHHTGDLWRAMDNVSGLVKPGGRLFISIYNDQGMTSRYWTAVKRLYNRNAIARVILIAMYTPYFVWSRWLYRKLTGKSVAERGMSMWYDMLDWLGGYPFEVAKPEDVFRFLHQRGFALRELVTAGGGLGCNQYVFQKSPDPEAS